MTFVKMHGIGNDYIYFDCTKQVIENPEELSVKLSDRHKGVGGDGIIMIMKSDVADFRMRMFNADGSEGKMCGNATRCIGKYVYDLGLTDKKELTLETLSGIKHLLLDVENGKVRSVSVNMGKPVLTPRDIPVISDKERVINEPFTIGGKEYFCTVVSMGNPHNVIFVDDVDTLPLEAIGSTFENFPIFPDRVNTEFVKQIDRTTLRMRVWERGSGETMACGTGACATVVAAALNGRVPMDTDITVRLNGGDLTIKYCSDRTVWMTGPAEFVYKGELI